MIFIKHTQKKVAVDLKQIEKNAQTLLNELDYADFDLGIWLTTNASIRAYNKRFRNKNKPTDILSFPNHPELKAGERIQVNTEDDKNLGDIIISLEYVKADAQKLGVTFEYQMNILLVHGICHLLGYDHIEDNDYEAMHKKEQILLKTLTD